MRRQLPPHIKVAGPPTSAPPSIQRYLAESTTTTTTQSVVVNHYSQADRLIPAIPGFKTSAAFLTSLSANLRIDPDLPSPLGTPNFRSTSLSHLPLPPPSPLHFSIVPSTGDYYNPYPSPAETEIMSTTSPSPIPDPPVQALPELKTYTSDNEEERYDGLKLIADSVAQQRQLTSKMLIFHPVNMAVFALTLAIISKYLYKDFDSLLLIGTTIGGLTMCYLAAVRMISGPYLTLAEDINWDWLGEDKLIVVKWGEEIIGSLVLGWASDEPGRKKGGGRRKRGKAVVRGWTVKLKYRGKGVGEGLLEEAVKVAGERGADGIVFGEDHANSKRILPSLYNGYMDKREKKAEKKLEKVADEKGNFRQRRSSPTWGSR
ncbi:hypothetical protein P154DRAFT_364568 [Amniculicola lignicola CBS 123094]|uniref:N-acetyltransferase domain-containing protein n=1 Tax=Amniculicola lignicola CBS 123094 TaxID=1392246 RepID=A0A6A5W0I4_9PLEO|nr:hypothetical protein P154DRAFT_364568 [Amniculicola lignicola CBS 123094]